MQIRNILFIFERKINRKNYENNKESLINNYKTLMLNIGNNKEKQRCEDMKYEL